VPYPVVVLPGDAPFAQAYDIRNYPTTFVIDPQGVLRARHADNLLPRPQLHAYIVAARRGTSVPVDTAFQRQLDALLDPARFAFTGDAAAVLAAASAASDAIAKADDLQDDAMSDVTRDHDLLRTQEEEAKLRDAAIAALAASDQSAPGAVLLARLRGDQAVALGQWDVAAGAYAHALDLAPNDVGALSGAQRAAQQRGDTAAALGFADRIATVAPSYQHEVGRARARAKNGDREGAFAAFDRALTLASTPAARAWTLLATGRVAVQLGDLARARTAFAGAVDAAAQVPPQQAGFTLYSEQAQEAMIALGPTPGARVGISAAPWTGEDLPGSIQSTVKYRIAVTGAAHTPVRLVARGVPKDWVGSWCTDRVCQPTATDVVVPPSGVKIVEFQIVPDDPAHANLHPQVRIDAKAATIASVTVRG
jgi:tetratricopeptide (TPR) repeat protein